MVAASECLEHMPPLLSPGYPPCLRSFGNAQRYMTLARSAYLDGSDLGCSVGRTRLLPAAFRSLDVMVRVAGCSLQLRSLLRSIKGARSVSGHRARPSEWPPQGDYQQAVKTIQERAYLRLLIWAPGPQRWLVSLLLLPAQADITAAQGLR